MTKPSPQNPYDSYLVEASAGSGKTYQLSRRFLFLVGSGAVPSTILTITFTVKAAGEMRARILQDATQLLVDKKAQAEFDKTLEQFYQSELTKIKKAKDADPSTENPEENSLRPPRSAVDTAKEILASTQLLKISTIDSLFNQWIGKFPFEASGGDEAKESLPSPFSLMDSLDQADYDYEAWSSIFKKAEDSDHLTSLDIYEHFETTSKGPLTILGRLEELHKQQTYLWQAQEMEKTQVHLLKKPSELGGSIPETETELVKNIAESLRTCADVVANRDEILTAIQVGTIQALIDCKLLTKAYKVSGQKIRGPKREALIVEIETIESEINHFYNEVKIKNLNSSGLALFSLYSNWVESREALKRSTDTIEFADLAKGAYRLFNHQAGMGATWLIQKTVRHLMIDEFQDTSLLQWAIFKKLALELLSGEGVDEETGTRPSLFIVGDEKQSIYGFREGNPIVLQYARETLQEFGKSEIPMNQSFRSSQIVLDYVNKVFESNGIDQFPSHSTAYLSPEKSFIPNCGAVTVHEQFESDAKNIESDCDRVSGLQKEANYVAQTLKKALSNPENHPVYDKSTGTFRPLRHQDCCIMYRSGTHVETFEKALREAGLPCLKEEKKGFFQRQEIQDTMALFSYLVRPADSLSLITILKSPYGRVPDSQVLDLIQRASDKKGDKNLSDRILDELSLDAPLLCRSLRSLLLLADVELPHQVLNTAYAVLQAPVAFKTAFSSAEGELAKNNLLKMLEICVVLEEKGHASLSSCLKRLVKMAERDEMGNAPADTKAITLMTIHKSKGLEFPFICLIETGGDWFKLDKYWVKNERDPDGGIAYIGTKANQPIDNKNFDSLLELQKKQLEEEAYRLLYVALTRASHYLLITGHKPLKGGTESLYEILWVAIEELEPDTSIQGQLTIDSRNGIQAEKRQDPSAQNSLGSGQTNLDDWQPLQIQGVLPSEIEIVQPHNEKSGQTIQKKSRQEVKLKYPELASKVGNFIHKCFELSVLKQDFEPASIWQAEVRQFFNHWKLDQSEWIRLFEFASGEFEKCLSSDSWASMFTDLASATPEMEIIHFYDQKMVRGSIDLLIEKSDGEILIVDYKTTVYAKPQDSDQDSREVDLIQFCQEKGFHNQLNVYSNAMSAMHPNKIIKTGVFLTKEAELVYLS